jgi:hypothetical protein
MKRVLMFCLLVTPLMGSAATTPPALLTWHAPKTLTNGNTLPASDIKKHTVKCGLESGKYTMATDVVMPAVQASADFAARGKDGYRYCVVTATNKAGQESPPSSEIRFFVSSGRVLADNPNRFASASQENRAPAGD